MKVKQILPGDPAPYFAQRSETNPRYNFDTAAGRWLVLAFLGSAANPLSAALLREVLPRTDLFNDSFASFFAVTADPEDEAVPRLRSRVPGFRVFWDFDRTVARLYGGAPETGDELLPLWLVLDPTMRVVEVMRPRGEPGEAAAFIARLARLPPPARFAGIELQAPVLYLPNVFEPAFCQHLIALYEAQGGEESGFMRQIDGKTVGMTDRRHKSRKDVTIEDQTLIQALQARIQRRVVPEIAKVHQFQVTRMERYIVSCYAAEEGGHFAAHRDNTTAGTAHRRFAVSINLNADFDGGEVSFPEYGPRSFKAPPGGAVVFSCSLLHAVSQVTRGRRYAFLPFLYDDAAADLRQRNLHLIETRATAQSG